MLEYKSMQPINFVKESIAEFNKVSWPNKNQTIRLTAYVIGVSLVVGIFISSLDFLFGELLKIVIR